MVTKSIERMRLKNATEVDVIVKNGLNEPEGIAVDWINRKLYWTDSGAHKIEVSDLDGKKRLPLVTSRLENPRAIAVHPFVGWVVIFVVYVYRQLKRQIVVSYIYIYIYVPCTA